MDLGNFLDIRFGQDQRILEVGRLLLSSKVTNVKMPGERESRYVTLAISMNFETHLILH